MSGSYLVYNVEKTQRKKKSKQIIISEDLKYPPISLPQFSIGGSVIIKFDMKKQLLLAPEGQQIHLLLQHLGILVYCLTSFF